MRPGIELDALRALFGGLLESGGGNDFLGGMISAQDTVLPESPRFGSPRKALFSTMSS